MQAYYNRISGYIGELPDVIYLSNGLTRTDRSSYSDEEIEEWGYVLLPDKPTPAIDEFISLDIPTLEWQINKKPHEPEWEEVRKKRNQLLAETDWYVIRFIERGTPIPEEITTYRKALRDITLQENPFFIQWPQIFPDTTSSINLLSIK